MGRRLWTTKLCRCEDMHLPQSHLQSYFRRNMLCSKTEASVSLQSCLSHPLLTWCLSLFSTAVIKIRTKVSWEGKGLFWPHGWLSLLFYATQKHLPRHGATHHGMSILTSTVNQGNTLTNSPIIQSNGGIISTEGPFLRHLWFMSSWQNPTSLYTDKYSSRCLLISFGKTYLYESAQI